MAQHLRGEKIKRRDFLFGISTDIFTFSCVYVKKRASEQIKEQAREIDDKTLHIMYVVIKKSTCLSSVSCFAYYDHLMSSQMPYNLLDMVDGEVDKNLVLGNRMDVLLLPPVAADCGVVGVVVDCTTPVIDFSLMMTFDMD